MTLEELQRWIALEIAGRYHQHAHRGLHAIPAQVWQRATRDMVIRKVEDPTPFVIDFLPAETRSIMRNGLQLGLIRYWDPFLTRVFPLGTHLLVRFDPRDLSRIFVPALSDSDYLILPYANLRQPPITLAERERARAIAQKGSASVSEERLFAAAAEQRKLEEAAQRQSSRARRSIVRRPKKATPATIKRAAGRPVDCSRPPVPYEGEEW